jgi:hypothetical protein
LLPADTEWPSQDGVDRSSHIAILAILDPKLEDPDGHIRDWEFVNRAGEIERLVRDQFDEAVKAAVGEVLESASASIIDAEHYQVGPATGGLIGLEHYLATLADSRDGLLALLGIVADGWAVYEIVRRARRRLNEWIAGFGDSRLAISLSFPPATLCLLCEEHVRRNYHPRAYLTSEWYCLTHEFYGGYVSPGHPTEAVEYLILVSTSKETYRFRLWGSGLVAIHSVRRGRLDADLPLPDLLEARESADGQHA